MQTTDESCRHPAHIESDLLSAGHEIYLDGKKLKGSRRSARNNEEGKSNGRTA